MSAIIALGFLVVFLEVIFRSVVAKTIEAANTTPPQHAPACLVLGAALIALAVLIGYSIHALIAVAKDK